MQKPELTKIVTELGIEEAKNIGGIAVAEFLAKQGVIAQRAGISLVTAIRRPTAIGRLTAEIAMRATEPVKTAKTVKKVAKV